MKNKIGLLAILALTLFSAKSFAFGAAGLLLEPMVTYQTGEQHVHNPAPFNDSNDSSKGVGLGLRAGVHLLDIVFVALDGRYSRPNYHSDALGGNAFADQSNLGVTAGVQTPILGIRLWGTYIFTGELDPAEINNVNVRFHDFDGYRVGAGLYVSVVSLNVEYQDGHYRKTDGQNGMGYSTSNIQSHDQSVIFSVSAPLVF